MFSYKFTVPERKRVRMIIHTDCKNEADDQYALAHQLMTPMLDIRGIIAGHFEIGQTRYPAGTTAMESLHEVNKILALMGLSDEYEGRVYLGASAVLTDVHTPIVSPGAEFIISEALRDDPRPLYIGMQGAITDLACAILMEPKICSRITAIWIGGGDYPEGGSEFNLSQDILAANVVFNSSMSLWQIPKSVYKQFAVTLAELQRKVQPYGAIGNYLFEQMAAFNLSRADDMHWPHGETWGLGDQGVIAALLDEREKCDGFNMIPAPNCDPVTMQYFPVPGNREIRVYHKLNDRQTLEDFFCKLQLNFPQS